MSNIFSFEYPLPFHIPLEANLTVVEELDGGTIYLHLEEDRAAKIYRDVQSHHAMTLARVEFRDKLPDVYDINNFPPSLLQEIFHQGLQMINGLIDAIRESSDLVYLHNVVTTELPPVIGFVINGQKIPYITCPHRLLGENDAKIDNEGFSKAWNLMQEHRLHPNQAMHRAFFHRARSQFVLGRHSESVLNLQTSVEVLVRKIVEHSVPEKSIQEIERLPFRNQIEHVLSASLGRDLSFDRNPVVKSWRNHVYKLRNNIVHGGDSADLKQARQALRVFIRLHNYLAGLARTVFPDLDLPPVALGNVSLAEHSEVLKKIFDQTILSFPKSVSRMARLKFRWIRFRSKLFSIIHRIRIWIFRHCA